MKQFQTLFDKYIFNEDSDTFNTPYSIAVNCFLDDFSKKNRDDNNVEIDVFRQVLEHENWLYEPRGKMIGEIDIYEYDRLVYSDTNQYYKIPSWVEGDSCRFGDFVARSIIITTSFNVFEIMKNAGVHKLLNAIIILTSGVPRFITRRFIYSLKCHTHLPVFCLVDNDTWGYFSYSVLLRGCLAPYKKYEFNAVPDCHFLGLNATHAEMCVSNGCPISKWKPIWTKRIKALSLYDCFSSEKWQNEFKRFSEHGYAVDLGQALQYCGFEWIVDEIAAACACPRTLD
jgi:DNA topoisomerase-6 subunit A